MTDKMGQMVDSAKEGVKTGSLGLLNVSIKFITGFVIGLTLALIGQEILRYGTFSFVFVMVVTIGIVFRSLLNWRLLHVLLFDVFCILVGLLLKMYILVAP